MTGLPLPSDASAHAIWRHTARACIVIAAVFCCFMVAALGVLWAQQKMHHPLVEAASGRIADLHAQLRAEPTSATLKTEIRQADAEVREAYWRRQVKLTRGAWLLLAGTVVLVGGIKIMRATERRLPTREAVLAPHQTSAESRLAQWTVGGMGGAMLLLLLAGGWWSMSHPVFIEAREPRVAESPVTLEELKSQCPGFRGWGGAVARIPEPAVTHWDAGTGENILWRVPVPLPGTSSPIIWDNTVVVTGAHESQRAIFAYDLVTGQQLWQTAVAASGSPPSIFEETSFAAPTPVTDGRRAYAIFATGDIAAVDLATGRKVWEKSVGRPASVYGYASSLTLFADPAGTKVIVQWDMGAPEDNRSSLMALDGRTGAVLWQTRRPVGASWSSPLLTSVEKDAAPWQVVTTADPWVIGYDAATGAELWRIEALKGDVAPSPVAAVRDGKTWVYPVQEASQRVGAPITGARGTIEPAWSFNDEGMPDIVSPVSDGRYVWTIISSGVLFCFDAGTGKKLWERAFDGSFHATPAIVRVGNARELWLTNTIGVTHRLAIGEQFQELGVCALEENVDASIAFDSNRQSRLVIRGRKHLYCIGDRGTR